MAKSMQSPRLPELSEATLTAEQRALADSIKSGPRGQFKMSGPFAVYLHAPAFGELAQKLGGHVRFKTSVSPRLSEFAILVTAQQWKAQYEWAMHAPMAEKQGVKPETVRDLQAGPRPTSLRSTISPKSFMPTSASASRPITASTSCWARPAQSSWSASSATTPWCR